ncbi:MAG: transketolase, partial [bacterium]|nr:transketolase [bacterium]
MEGVTSEACSLAGHLKLGKLNVLYDANRITIDGATDLTFTEDVRKRYKAYGWHTLEVPGNGSVAIDAIDAALAAAKAETARPTLVLVRTHIGYGSPAKQDSHTCHGAPLGADEVAATKRNLGWDPEREFHVPPETRRVFAEVRRRGEALEAAWDDLRARYQSAFPAAAKEFEERLDGGDPSGWEELLPRFGPDDGPLATRQASGMVLNAVSDGLPQLVGGSADLAPSNNTYLKGKDVFSVVSPGPNIHFGVREHAMGAVLNGMALSKMLRPYGGTFLVFCDYMRPAIRMAAMMKLPVIYVFTHDSIFLGEDGPTHQPISQLLSLRAIPGLVVLRPADANETVAAWRSVLENRHGPKALILSRQKLPIMEETADLAPEGLSRGAYVLADPPDAEPEVLLLATGSEVALVREAHRRLLAEGIATRVVSMPCWSWFDAQDDEYRESVLPSHIHRRLAVEAGSPLGWHKYAGPAGDVLAIEGFGLSAPARNLAEEFGFTPEEVVRRVKALL